MRRLVKTQEQGSIPLALVASIILAGVIVALYATVQSSQRSVQRDRDVNQSIQVADMGVQEAFVRMVQEGDESTSPLYADVGDLVNPVSDQVVDGQAAYTWQVRRTGRSLWEGRSVGTYRTHTSVVDFEVGLLPMFEHALWGTTEAGIQAGNATIASLDSTPPVMGSNGPITLHNSIAALVPDNLIVECHNNDPNIAASNCSGITNADIYSESVAYPDLGSAAFAPRAAGKEYGGECWDAGEGEPIIDSFDGTLEGGRTYCLSQLTWPRGTEFQITPGVTSTEVTVFISPTPSAGDPEAAVLVGGTGAANASIVNWLPVSMTDPTQITTSASDLLVVVAGTRPVEFRNNSSRIAFGLYAPLARCEVRAQVTVVGAMICGEIPTTGPGSASGGWTFYYDSSLEELEVDGIYRIRSWAQESCAQGRPDLPGVQCPTT